MTSGKVVSGSGVVSGMVGVVGGSVTGGACVVVDVVVDVVDDVVVGVVSSVVGGGEGTGDVTEVVCSVAGEGEVGISFEARIITVCCEVPCENATLTRCACVRDGERTCRRVVSRARWL